MKCYLGLHIQPLPFGVLHLPSQNKQVDGLFLRKVFEKKIFGKNLFMHA